MKTTLELDDQLSMHLNEAADLMGISVSAYIEQTLKQKFGLGHKDRFQLPLPKLKKTPNIVTSKEVYDLVENT